MTRRSRILRTLAWVAPAVVLAAGLSFIGLPIRDVDKVRAAEQVIAWVTSNTPVRGEPSHHPQQDDLRTVKRFFVYCDFVPVDRPLTVAPHVTRHRLEDNDADFATHQYNATGYIYVRGTMHGTIAFDVRIVTSMDRERISYGFTFRFRRIFWGLRGRIINMKA